MLPASPPKMTPNICLDKASEDILAYQAARHALGAIRKVLEQSTKLAERSGKLPVYLDEEYCRDE